MVHRHIHGTVVTIFTESVTHTGSGYLSRSYTSRYTDPASGEPATGDLTAARHPIHTYPPSEQP